MDEAEQAEYARQRSLERKSHEPVFWDQNRSQLFWERNANHEARVPIDVTPAGELLAQLGGGELPPGVTLLQTIINGVAEQVDFSEYFKKPEVEGLITQMAETLAVDYNAQVEDVRNQLQQLVEGLGQVLAEKLGKADKATGEEVESGAADKWIDAAEFRGKLTQALQYIEDKFSISMPDGSVAQIGMVFTLRAVRGANGAMMTTYGWEPLPAGVGSGLTLQEVINQLVPYAKLADADQLILLKELSGYQVTANVVKATELQLSVSTGIGISTEAPGSEREVNRVVLYRTNTADGKPIEPLAFVSDLAAYAKLRDSAQIIEARVVYGDDLCTDLIKFNGTPGNLNSYDWAMGVRQSFVTGAEALMLGNEIFPEGVEVLNRADGVDLLRLVQQWFVAANLPEPVLPAHALRSVATVLRREVPPGNRMAPEAIDEALQRSVGSLVGRELSPAALERLRQVVSDPGWDGTTQSLQRSLPQIEDALAAVAPPADPFVRQSQLTAPYGAIVTPVELEQALQGLQQIQQQELWQLRLRAPAAATPFVLTAQTWTRLVAEMAVVIDGPWSLEAGRICIPDTAQYDVFAQVVCSETTTGAAADLLVRIAGSAGVYSGDSASVGGLGGLVEHSSTLAAAAGDWIEVQVFCEGVGVKVYPGTLSITVRRSGAAPDREVWSDPPGVWGSAMPTDSATVANRSIALVVSPRTFGAAGAAQSNLAVETSGGALATVSGSTIQLGSQVGRLFRVSGRLDRATDAALVFASNAAGNTTSLGANPNLPAPLDALVSQQWPQRIGARATATRSDFSTPSFGPWADPSTFYVSTSAATAQLQAGGTVAGSGGRLTFTDITPGGGAYIGCDFTFTGAPVTLIAGGGDANSALANNPSANNLIRCDLPNLVGVGSGASVGHHFRLNTLPNGFYILSGEWTVEGEHGNCGWKVGWDANAMCRDQYLPAERTLNSDNTVTYRCAFIYRLGSVDTATVGLYFALDAPANPGGKVVKITGWSKLRRVSAAMSPTVEIPLVDNQVMGTANKELLFKHRAQILNGYGPLSLNAGSAIGLGDPYGRGKTWSAYGASTLPDAGDLIGTHGLYHNIGTTTGVGSVRWIATLDMYCDGALAGAELRQRRVGTNGTSTNLLNIGKQPDGLFLYRIGLEIQPIDGKWWENFLVTYARASVANTKIIRGSITFRGEVNPLAMP